MAASDLDRLKIRLGEQHVHFTRCNLSQAMENKQNVKHVSESQPDFLFGFEKKERPRNGIFGIFPSRKNGAAAKKRKGGKEVACLHFKIQPSRSGKGEMFLLHCSGLSYDVHDV